MSVYKPMFDTVAGKFEGGPYLPKDQSRNAWETRTRTFFDPRLARSVTTVTHSLNRSEARVAIMGDGYVLRLEASLPKLIHGNNVASIINPEPALKRLGEFTRDFIDGPFTDLFEMEYLRVDYCHNFSVGAALPDYVSTLGNVSFLKHRRSTDGYGGVEWWSDGGRRIRVYDKFKEILETERREIPEARGLLRFEVQLRKKSGYLQRRVKEKRLTLRDILVPELAHYCLDETLVKMCLSHEFTTRDAARNLLDQFYSYQKATRLLGVSRRLETATMDDIRRLSSRSTFYSDKKNLRRLGLWPPSASPRTLPPLLLPPLDQLIAIDSASIEKNGIQTP